MPRAAPARVRLSLGALLLAALAAGCNGAHAPPPPGAADTGPAAQAALLRMMEDDIRVFLRAGQYAGCLEQLAHYRRILVRLPEPAAEAVAYRRGALPYYEGLCHARLERPGPARAALEAAAESGVAPWAERAEALIQRLQMPPGP